MHPLVYEWVQQIPHLTSASFAEPFGGSNNIVKMIMDAFSQITASQWVSYDVEPEAVLKNQVPEVPLVKRDTLLKPVSSDVVVTNPPYLAKNSTTRMGINVDFGKYQDLYELALSKILAHSEYVAAIIPESFLTRSLFKERLFGFVSIPENLFADTEFPVGVGLWTLDNRDDYMVYVGSKKVGFLNEIHARTSLFATVPDRSLKIVYNDPQGSLGLHAVDTPSAPTIRYVDGDEIDSLTVKNTSRAITRISVVDSNNVSLITPENLSTIVERLNILLEEYREQSYDLFLTSFKGLRKDGRYRRRLDWKTSTLLTLCYPLCSIFA